MNFLDQALNLFGLKSPNSTDYYDPSVYRAEVNISEAPSKPTKVEQYQQKKNSSAVKSKELSGVAKYLAEKQAPAQEKINLETEISEEKLTGVAMYLGAKQQEQQLAYENMTKVEQYLYRKKTGHQKTQAVTPTPTVAPEKLSRVDIYLAKKQGVKLEHKVITSEKKSPKEVLSVSPDIKSKETEPKDIDITPAIEDPTPQIIDATKNEIIDLSEGAGQCQASTTKRTQCSRKTSLETIEQSINQKQYRFAVCSQHNKDNFIPFAQILQEKSH